jgi:L-2,4-diaminobutyric acid acetyltransferase
MKKNELDTPHLSSAVAPAVRAQTHTMRLPTRKDGAAIHHLLGEHFSDTCVLAESAGGRINGFISAYVIPTRPDVLFVWQVAVHARARGHRLGRAMLRELLQRKGLEHVRYLETTVGPDNQASRRSFTGLAGELGAHVSEQPFFDRQLFGGADHDDEMLLRIGPFALPAP